MEEVSGEADASAGFAGKAIAAARKIRNAQEARMRNDETQASGCCIVGDTPSSWEDTPSIGGGL